MNKLKVAAGAVLALAGLFLIILCITEVLGLFQLAHTLTFGLFDGHLLSPNDKCLIDSEKNFSTSFFKQYPFPVIQGQLLNCTSRAVAVETDPNVTLNGVNCVIKLNSSISGFEKDLILYHEECHCLRRQAGVNFTQQEEKDCDAFVWTHYQP